MKNRQSRWVPVGLVAVACGQALPAAAEGGGLPSIKILLIIALAYLLLVPVIATAMVYVTMKMVRPQKVIRGKQVFAIALAAWIAALLLFNYSDLNHYLFEKQATLIGAVLVFGIAFATAFFARAASPPSAP